MFAFSGPAARIAGVGAGRAVPRGPAATLQARLSSAGGVIGGALPFRREDDDYLWQARCVRNDAAAPHPAAAPLCGVVLDRHAVEIEVAHIEDGTAGAKAAAPGYQPWSRRYVTTIKRAPVAVVLAAVVVLLAIATPFLHIRLGLPDQGSQPTSQTTRAAITVVLPDPAPAMITPGSSGAVIASS